MMLLLLVLRIAVRIENFGEELKEASELEIALSFKSKFERSHGGRGEPPRWF